MSSSAVNLSATHHHNIAGAAATEDDRGATSLLQQRHTTTTTTTTTTGTTTTNSNNKTSNKTILSQQEQQKESSNAPPNGDVLTTEYSDLPNGKTIAAPVASIDSKTLTSRTISASSNVNTHLLPSASTSTTTSTSPSSSGTFMKLKTYLHALRPWSLSGSLVPTLMGSALAYRSQWSTQFSLITFFLTAFTVVTVHCAGNVVNTYFDFIKGIDKQKADDRTLVDHILTKDEVVSLGAILYMAGCVGFICLAILSPAKMEHLALIYFGGLSSSFLYTGGIGFKYIALGDLVILILFGPLSVLFAFMSQTGHVDWTTIYYAIPLALNTEAILHSNNTRDADNDRKAGIVTLAILIGRTASHVLYALLLFTPYSIFVVYGLKYSLWFLLPLITVPQAFQIEKRFRNEMTMNVVPRQTAKLNFFFGILYVVACCCAKQLPTFYRRH